MQPIGLKRRIAGRKDVDVQTTHKIARVSAMFFACGMFSACTTAGWQRWFYDIGDQYACQRSGAHQRDAQARAAQCAVANHPDRTRFEDYQAAREQTATADK